jgi:hypothetical protein
MWAKAHGFLNRFFSGSCSETEVSEQLYSITTDGKMLNKNIYEIEAINPLDFIRKLGV